MENVKYGKPNKLGMVPIIPHKLKGIKKGDNRFLWYKGDIRKVTVTSTYDQPDTKGICIDYELKGSSGNLWVNINELFINAKDCFEDHVKKVKGKHKKEIEKLDKFAEGFK